MRAIAAVDQLRGDAQLLAVLAHAAFQKVGDAQLLADDPQVLVLALEREARRPPVTRSALICASWFRISSVRPSEKYSCSGSEDMFANGSTASVTSGASALVAAGA